MGVSIDYLIEENQNVPAWLEPFLKRTFFGACPNHELQKNELNMYCITCEIGLCRYCIAMGNHNDHRLLKIYRHVYQDVVPLKEMEDHIDCSNIQPYKCNKKWIIAINPLPHCGSGAQIDEDLSCFVCKRKLMDPDQYRYCCIACKVKALSKKRKGVESPASALETSTAESDQMEIKTGGTRKRRRKGAPIRAPLR